MEFTPEYLAALRSEYAAQASDSQFSLWIEDCKRRNLVPQKDVVLQIRGVKEYDPIKREKVFVKKAIYITTIAAFLKLSERSGKYAGKLPTKWVYLDDNGAPTIESEVPLPDKDRPAQPRIPWAAKVSVLRKDFDTPITEVARFGAYAQYFNNDGNQTLNSTWSTRGPEQLAKCCLAAALRLSFPEELSAIYLEEELKDEETVQAIVQPKSTENVQKTAGEQLNELKKAVAAAVEKETKKCGRPARKEAVVKDSGKPWGGEFEPQNIVGDGSNLPMDLKAAQEKISAMPTVAVPEVGANIHGVTITDDDVPFPGDEKPATPEPVVQKTDNRLATADERKVFMARLITLKDKGFTGIREYLLKESGQTITNDIPFARMSELVDRLEKAEIAGTLKGLLG